jgi:hypothetical protein
MTIPKWLSSNTEPILEGFLLEIPDIRALLTCASSYRRNFASGCSRRDTGTLSTFASLGPWQLRTGFWAVGGIYRFPDFRKRCRVPWIVPISPDPQLHKSLVEFWYGEPETFHVNRDRHSVYGAISCCLSIVEIDARLMPVHCKR